MLCNHALLINILFYLAWNIYSLDKLNFVFVNLKCPYMRLAVITIDFLHKPLHFMFKLTEKE